MKNRNLNQNDPINLFKKTLLNQDFVSFKNVFKKLAEESLKANIPKIKQKKVEKNG